MQMASVVVFDSELHLFIVNLMHRVKYIGGHWFCLLVFFFFSWLGTGAVGEDVQGEIKTWNTINEC